MGGEESGVFSGSISLREGMAGKKEILFGEHRTRDDTRQDPPGEAFAEADFADPGGQGGDDTRQDRAEKAKPVYVCGLWIGKRTDTRQNGIPAERGLSWTRSQPEGGNHGFYVDSTNPPAL